MIKAIKILLIILLINTIALFAVSYGNASDFLNSIVNFSMTISDSGQPPPSTPNMPQKPSGILPENEAVITLPFLFTASPFQQDNGTSTHIKTNWFFAHSQADTEPFFQAYVMADGSVDLTKFMLQPPPIFPSTQFQSSMQHFWKARYMNSADVWSDFSDVKKFYVEPPPVPPAVPPATSLGGGGGGGSGGGYRGSWSPPSYALIPSTGGISKPPPKTLPTDKSSIKKAPVKKTTKPTAKKAPAKKSSKDTSKPPVNIKLQQNKIQNGKPIKLKIQPSPQPAKQEAAPAQKTNKKRTKMKPAQKEAQDTRIKINIRKKPVPSALNWNKEIFVKKASAYVESIDETSSFEAGLYTATMNYELDNNLYSFIEEFEIVPQRKINPNTVFTALIWNEFGLTIILLGTVSIFYFKHKIRRI